MKGFLSFIMFAGMLLPAGFCPDAYAQRPSSKTLTTTKLEGVQETVELTEAFSLDAGHEMLVAPLVATVKVLFKEHAIFTGSARQDVPRGLAGNEYLASKVVSGKRETTEVDMDLLKAQATYDFCRETNADLIVAPQFNIRHRWEKVSTTDAEGNPVEVECPVERDGKYVMVVNMVGYPAVYSGFREGTENDGWIKELFREGKISNKSSNITVDETTIKSKDASAKVN